MTTTELRLEQQRAPRAQPTAPDVQCDTFLRLVISGRREDARSRPGLVENSERAPC